MRWTAATVFFVGVMALAGWYVFNQAVQGGSYVLVPDVTGLPVTRAANVLAEAGLELGTQRQVQNDRIPEYHVIVQRPSANRVVRAGRKVSLTISAGTQFETAPGFIGKPLGDALKELESTRLRAGSVARIPNSLPADTVLAQDPEPRSPIAVGGEIHLLVSDGPGRQPFIMPSLVGKSLEDAQILLANLDVNVVPYKVNRPGEEYDTVLSQSPEPGSRLYTGQEVTFDVRLMPSSYLPNARRKVTVRYTVPDTGRPVAVRAETIDQHGNRTLLYPRTTDFVDGRPPRLDPGTTITFTDIAFTSELTVEFFTDGMLQSSYYYEGDAEPIVTTHDFRSGVPTIGGGAIQEEDLGAARPRPFTRRPPRFRTTPQTSPPF